MQVSFRRHHHPDFLNSKVVPFPPTRNKVSCTLINILSPNEKQTTTCSSAVLHLDVSRILKTTLVLLQIDLARQCRISSCLYILDYRLVLFYLEGHPLNMCSLEVRNMECLERKKTTCTASLMSSINRMWPSRR